MAKTEKIFPDTTTGGRIQKLRRDKHLTRAELHRLVFYKPNEPDIDNENRGKTVRNWEDGSVLPPYDKLTTLCDIFGCDADYLLCRQDTPRKATVDIMKETGLSEKSVSNLRTYNDPDKPGVRAFIHKYTETIDYLLSHQRIEHFLIPIAMALKLSKAPSQSDIDHAMDVFESRRGHELLGKDIMEAEQIIALCGNVVLSIDDAARYYARQAGDELSAILTASIEQQKREDDTHGQT